MSGAAPAPQPRPSKLRGRRASAVCRYSLPFCKPDEVVNQAENLGEVRLALRPSAAVRSATHSLTRAQVMRGDRVMNSPYEIKMHIEESCKVRQTGCTGRQREAAAVGWQWAGGL